MAVPFFALTLRLPHISYADNQNRYVMQSTSEATVSTTSATSITTSTFTTSSAARDDEESVSEKAILACCQLGDITKLKLWNSLGINVLFSKAPLENVAAFAHIDAICYLANELSADVNQGTSTGSSPLMVAAKYGRLEILRRLVGELGADVEQATRLVMVSRPFYLRSRKDFWTFYDAW
jgi:hypothetical protein